MHTAVNNPGNYNFYWAPNGETSQNITVTQAGDYTVTVTDTSTSCFTTVDIHLDASEAPVLEAVEVIDLVQINSISIVVSGNGDYWYSLDNGNYQQSNFLMRFFPANI